MTQTEASRERHEPSRRDAQTPAIPGSQPLPNTKHELFAQHIVKGDGPTVAYVAAGYAKSRGNAARLRADEAVDARITWLMQQAAAAAIVDRTWIMDHLALNVQLALAREETGAPKATYSGAVANRGLHLLGLEHGMFKEKIELGGAVQVQNTELLRKMTPEERAAMRAMLLAAAARTPAPANDDQAAIEDGDVVSNNSA